jgi:hypothetical protein
VIYIRLGDRACNFLPTRQNVVENREKAYYMLSCLVVSYTQRPSGFKAIIKPIFKTNLPSLTSALLLADSFALSFLKFTKSCKNESKNEIYLQEIYQIIKSRNVSHSAVVMQSL